MYVKMEILRYVSSKSCIIKKINIEIALCIIETRC